MNIYDPTWNEYLAETWKKYLPPIRPAEEELQIFNQLLESEMQLKGAHLSVLILGSTPELRDLALAHHLATTVVDYSQSNYNAMSMLMREKGEEVFIKQNWLDMMVDKQFDVILSEAAFGVVHRLAIERLFGRIRLHLKPDGVVLAKAWIRLNNERPALEPLITDYRKRFLNKDFYSTICLPLFLHFYDYEQETIAVKYLSEQMGSLYEKGVITEAEWETIRKHHYENVSLELFIPNVSDLRVLLEKYFIIRDTISAGFEYSQYHPIFVLKPG